MREEFEISKGRITVRGKLVSRGRPRRADIVLCVKPNIPIAVIEAKSNLRSVGAGMQQALDYAERLQVPFAFSSNGDGFVFHDRSGHGEQTETSLGLDAFPGPEELWTRYRRWKGLDEQAEKIVLNDYHDDGSGKTPRYYQLNAINATIEAIAKGRDRILLVMATGTGKTYTAFQIIWRLWKGGQKKRILFLADRNVLIDQTMVNDFRPFSGAMAKLSTRSKTIERTEGGEVDLPLAVDRHRRIDTAYEIYLGLYQAITGPEEQQKLFKELSPDFFDLIVIDECHRGSAAEDSRWREILEHFSSATQIGMTATPKETEYVSNIAYFGEPVYSYSLKQGIHDGYLAPYKVVKVHIDRDVEGYRPEKGQRDRDGELIEDRIYNTKDFDRNLVIDDRTGLVARKVTQFLSETGDRFQKTIVFCVDQEHAARMRQALINENGDLVAENAKYVMRITGNDPEGQAQLGNFIDPESKYPVLVTTSRLLSTGVDAQTCRLIVLDREIGSMTEFKQIVGRGTRVHEDTGKYYFTLIDFRGATSHFADPDFDGEPVQIYQPGENDPVDPPEVEPDRPGTRPTRRRAWRIPEPGAGNHPVRSGPAPTRQERKAQEDLRRRRRRRNRRRARRIPGRQRQAGHRIAARLHPPRAQKALRQPGRLPEALERHRAQAGRRRGTGSRRPAAGPDPGRTGQGPRPVRPDLPRRLRRQTADAQGTRRECQEARRIRPTRRPGPRRARRAAGQVRRRRRAQPRRHQRAQDPAAGPHRHPGRTGQRLRRQTRLRTGRPRPAKRTLPGARLIRGAERVLDGHGNFDRLPLYSILIIMRPSCLVQQYLSDKQARWQ